MGQKGDVEGEFTFTGWRGNSVIDYVKGGEEVREGVVRMRMEDKVVSDHQSVEIWLR